MEDREICSALDRHWAASDADDFEAEHDIYREDAVLEYPQSGERIRGRTRAELTSLGAVVPTGLCASARMFSMRWNSGS